MGKRLRIRKKASPVPAPHQDEGGTTPSGGNMCKTSIYADHSLRLTQHRYALCEGESQLGLLPCAGAKTSSAPARKVAPFYFLRK